jgi:hypothetical protein
MDDPKNNTAWARIFADFDILNKVSTDGYFKITSKSINPYREARLLTKIDHKSQLPKIFSDNKLSILPVTRGSYVIGTFETFADFSDEDVEVLKIEFPDFLESLNHSAITSEATAINCLFVSKILHHFTDEENLYPTVNGRMSSSSFTFLINSTSGPFTVNVENAQVEIDGGYEGEEAFVLIEAKIDLSDDFLVRQLFYPYKLWYSKINKRIRPVFLTYSNGIYHLREYTFDDVNNYNSIRLVKQQKYSVQEGTINLEIIQGILQNTGLVTEPSIPFPQADSFERIINLCELLQVKGTLTKEDITENYDFTSRQTDYYSNAGRYLGLIRIKKENDEIICSLTQKGEKLFGSPIIQRQKEFIKMILSHAVYSASLILYLEKGAAPTKDEIVAIMKQSNLTGIDSDSTYKRRASTIIGWLNWIIRQAEQ